MIPPVKVSTPKLPLYPLRNSVVPQQDVGLGPLPQLADGSDGNDVYGVAVYGRVCRTREECKNPWARTSQYTDCDRLGLVKKVTYAITNH